MEVNLISSSNLPEGSIFSVRAGNVRRQAPFTSTKPFRFPEHPAESPLKIELFQPVGSAYVVLRPGETQYKVNFPTGGAVAELHIRPVEGGGNAAEPQQEKEDSSETAKEAKEYLESHRVMQFVQALLQTLIKEKPADPFRYMSRHFTNGYEPNEKRAPVPSNLIEEPKVGADAPLDSSEVQSLRQKARDTFVQAQNTGKLDTALRYKAAQPEGRTTTVKPATEAEPEKLRKQAQDHLFSANASGKLTAVLKQQADEKAAKATHAKARRAFEAALLDDEEVDTKATHAKARKAFEAALLEDEEVDTEAAHAKARAAFETALFDDEDQEVDTETAHAKARAAFEKALDDDEDQAAKLKKDAKQKLVTGLSNGSLQTALANKGATNKDPVKK